MKALSFDSAASSRRRDTDGAALRVNKKLALRLGMRISVAAQFEIKVHRPDGPSLLRGASLAKEK
jgi:hypothetical protein